jgi:hypothetical protein
MTRGRAHRGDGGGRAWERLASWYGGGTGHPGDGDAALTALSDIGHVRRLLEQAELAAVRTARSHGKAWAEIATQLGVTRQSAWERWRDLDLPASDLTVVPDVVGLSWEVARAALFAARLATVDSKGEVGDLLDLGVPPGVVVAQRPQGGATVVPGSTVTVWLERGGGAGDREPRRPRPGPLSARALPDDLPDEFSGDAAVIG